MPIQLAGRAEHPAGEERGEPARDQRVHAGRLRLHHVLRRAGDADLAQRAAGQPEGAVRGRQGPQAQLRADVAGTQMQEENTRNPTTNYYPARASEASEGWV